MAGIGGDLAKRRIVTEGNAQAPTPELNWREQYAEDRRRAAEQQMWQLSAMSLAAQSFLYSQGIAASTSGPARILIAIVGLAAAVATAHVLIHRAFEAEGWRSVIDASRAERRTPSLRRIAMQAEAANYDPGGRDSLRKRSESSRLVRLITNGPPPAESWLAVLTVFALADLVVLGVGIAQSTQIGDPF